MADVVTEYADIHNGWSGKDVVAMYLLSLKRPREFITLVLYRWPIITSKRMTYVLLA
jgi:hypothetical protein